MPLLVRACELTDWNEKQAEQYMYVVSGNGESSSGRSGRRLRVALRSVPHLEPCFVPCPFLFLCVLP